VKDNINVKILACGESLRAYRLAFARTGLAIAIFTQGLTKVQKRLYFYQFGKLPCGKSKRSRMVKKRNRKIQDWYFKNYSVLGAKK